MTGRAKLEVADRWPVLYGWAHGAEVDAREVIRECRELMHHLGAQERDRSLIEGLRARLKGTQ